MEMEFSGNAIRMDKNLSDLDRLVIKFASVLEGQKIDYVIISGYIAILFGRSRNTEDVDLFIKELPYEKFVSFWNALDKEGFECIIEPEPKYAYNDYLKSNLSIRFAQKGSFMPNFELKFPKNKASIYSLRNKVEVTLGGHKLNTSELELQIAFKLSLGSEKDFEDARHLFNVFREHLDMILLRNHIRELDVKKQAERILWQRD